MENENKTPTLTDDELRKTMFKDKNNHSNSTPLVVNNSVSDSSLRIPDQEEKETILQIRNNIDLTRIVSVLNYGLEAQEGITQSSETMIKSLKLEDVGGSGILMETMIKDMRTVGVNDLKPDTFLSKIPVIGDLLHASVRKVTARFDTVADKIDETKKLIIQQKRNLEKDLEDMENMYNENIRYVRRLELFLIAANEELPNIYQREQALKDLALRSQDQLDTQNAADYASSVRLFEKRIDNLKIARINGLQMGVQVKLSSRGDAVFINDFIDLINTVIPQWSIGFKLAASMTVKEKAFVISTAAKDFSNQQALSNAERVVQMVSNFKEAASRNILDLDTIKQVNVLTIKAIEDNLTNYKTIKDNRIKLNSELETLENNLKNALLNTNRTQKELS